MFFKKKIKKNKKIGWALSSGSSRGYATIPIIQELQKNDIIPDVISASSVGSLIGAYFALYGEVDTLLEKAKSMSKKDFLMLIDLNNPKKSAIKGKKIKKFLEENFFGNATFNDLKIPLIINTTQINNFQSIFFTEGKLVDAIMASISIPGIFPPYKIGDYYYIDGGISKHLPYEVLFRKYNVDKVVAVDVIAGMSEFDDGDIKFSIFNILFHSFYSLLKTTKISNKYKEKVFLLIPKWEEKRVGSAISFHKIDKMVESGKKSIEQYIDEIKVWLKE